MAAAERARIDRGAWCIAAAFAAIHLFVAGVTAYGVFRDEMYYLACSKHLAWGYVDHPPLSIAVLALDRALFGESVLALRWVPAVAGGASVLLGAMLAREFGGGALAQRLTSVAIAFAPVNVGVAGLYSMNVFEPLVWSAIALCIARLARGAHDRTWLALGALAGLGLLNKHSTVFFVLACVAGVLVTSLRARMASRSFAFALVIAVVLVAPHVAWQAANGWPTVEFLRNAQEHKNAPVSPLAFLLGQVLESHPIGFVLLATGLVALLAAPSLRAFRALGVSAAVTVATLCALQAKSYYVAPLYPLLFAGGAAFVERWAASVVRQRVVTAYATVLALTGLALHPFAIAVLPPAGYVAYAQALGVKPPQNERSELGALPQHFADQFGWRELAETVARVHAALPESERGRAVVYAQNYGEAGAIDYFARELGLPPVCCGHNSYFGWGLPQGPIEVVIVIGGERDDHVGEFESVEPAAVHDHPLAMPYERELTLFVCRKPRRPLRECFADTRFYI